MEAGSEGQKRRAVKGGGVDSRQPGLLRTTTSTGPSCQSCDAGNGAPSLPFLSCTFCRDAVILTKNRWKELYRSGKDV
jgi:hypothetical protein